MSEVDQLIAKLREEADGWKPSDTRIAVLVREAAQALSDQQDHIDNMTCGRSHDRAALTAAERDAEEIRKAWATREPQLYAAERQVEELTRTLSSLREEYNRIRKLLEETVAP